MTIINKEMMRMELIHIAFKSAFIGMGTVMLFVNVPLTTYYTVKWSKEFGRMDWGFIRIFLIGTAICLMLGIGAYLTY